MDFKFKKSLILGVGAGFLLLGFYFLFLTLANSFSHAVGQFLAIRYWILILVAGFGLQVGLYTFIREKLKTAPGRVLATSGGISTGSMIACCLHHLVDILPIIGLAAAALFLIKYQILFLVIGIFLNLVGIIIMLEIIQKNNLAGDFLKKILVYDMARVKKLVIGLSLISVPITFFLLNQTPMTDTQSTPDSETKLEPQIIKNLPTKIDNQGGISFEVTPLDFSFGNPIKFQIKIDTHSGSLDFDLTEVATLEDEIGNKYQPLEWQGSGPGGHHRSGILIFPKLNNQTKKLKLVIIDDTYQRIFEWSLLK